MLFSLKGRKYQFSSQVKKSAFYSKVEVEGSNVSVRKFNQKERQKVVYLYLENERMNGKVLELITERPQTLKNPAHPSQA